MIRNKIAHRASMSLFLIVLLLISFVFPPLSPFVPAVVKAAGFIDFEDGVDGQRIRSTIPGLRFVTTDGQDWIYGDWRTGAYNGKYPNGIYTSNGNFFAWLGPNQGKGVIEFTSPKGATYLSIFVSTANSVTLTGYGESGEVLDTAKFIGGNTKTGRLVELRIDAPANQRFNYAIVSGTANYWLIDDLSTDAEGVPNQKTPLIFIPGIAGSRLLDGKNEVWPNAQELVKEKDDLFLDNLKLEENGIDSPQGLPKITLGDIIRKDTIEFFGQRDIDTYQSLIDYLGTRGYKESDGKLYVFPYDWRKDLDDQIVALDNLVGEIKSKTGVTKVNILAHSMGGLIAKAYITDAQRAASIDTIVTLGTPYLGAPKSFAIMHAGECFIISPFVGGNNNNPSDNFFPMCFSNQDRTKSITQNFPGVYTLLPTSTYFNVYPDGYYAIAYDQNNDGEPEGALDFTKTEKLIQDNHNKTILARVRAFQQKYMSNGFRNGTNGVRVYQFVGDGKSTPTPGIIREIKRIRWPKFWEWYISYDIREITGDGTVPLRSADLGRATGAASDYSGSVSFFYIGLEHGGLAKHDTNLRFTVLPRVADILEVRGQPVVASQQSLNSEQTPDDNGLLLSRPNLATSTQSTIQVADIRTQPILLQGRQFMLQGAADFSIVDNFGNTLSRLPDGTIENHIPGVNYRQLGNSTSLFLPEGGVYQISINGRQQDTLDLRIRTIVNEQVTQTTLYEDVPISSTSKATLTYTTLSTPSVQIQLDYDGDGTVDQTILPKRILDQKGSTDVIAPTSSVSLTGTKDDRGFYVGQVMVTINASDDVGGTGLDRVEYVLNDQLTVNQYTGPFLVDAGQVQYIVVRAVDKAGNAQEPLTFAQIGPYRTYLPIIRS